jgi:hypothetical protein
MPLIFAKPCHRRHIGALYGLKLFQHIRLYGILPAVVFEKKLPSGESPQSRAKIDISFSGNDVQPGVRMELPESKTGKIRELLNAVYPRFFELAQ